MTLRPEEFDTAGHEPTSVPSRTILGWGLALGALVVCALSLMAAFLNSLGERSALTPVITGESDPLARATAPLDPNQPRQRAEYERQQRELLNSYGWIDERQQTARIPIRRAMEYTAERYHN